LPCGSARRLALLPPRHNRLGQGVRRAAKRQVTFPAAVCEALAVYPGDTLVLRDVQAL